MLLLAFYFIKYFYCFYEIRLSFASLNHFLWKEYSWQRAFCSSVKRSIL